MIRFLCFLVVALSFNLVSCFDTGHHYDATRNGLELRNFSRNSDAIPIVQLCNFIPDWDSLSYEVNMPNFKYYKQLANLLHFGNLFNSTMVRDYWVQFIINQHDTVNAILNNTIQQKVNSQGDASLPLLDQQYLLLCTLGYTLHATQDFYAHSNYITSLVNQNMNNNNMNNNNNTNNTSTKNTTNNNNNNNNNNATCYYTANVYDIFNETTKNYNLHTYYWPEKDTKQQDMKKQIQPFWPNETLVKHGYYLDGINKDSYGKMNWDMAYSSAFMATLDVIDTWRGWIQNETLWNLLQNYNFTANATSNYAQLDEGQQQEFEFSNYLKVPGFDESKDGHWKGPNSGQFVETLKEASDWIRNDWQYNSPYQRAFYDTDISQRLTYGLNGTLGEVDSEFMIPNVTMATIKSFNATKLGLVINDPADYIAITVRTWGAGKWKTTPTNSSDQDIGGWYAIVGIDGQEFREATQYQSWIQPFWAAMRFIPVNQSHVTITYDLIDYADDDTLKSLFTNPDDVEAVIHPSNSSQPPQDTNLDVQTMIPANVSRVKQHSMRLVPRPSEEMMEKALGKTALLRERLHLSSHRVTTLNHRTNVSDPYTYRDTINPDDMNRTDHGVVFVMDTTTGKVISGLPSFYLNRAYLDVNHSLILQGVNNTANVAQVNITITPRHMCSTKSRTNGTIGEVGPAVVAAPVDGWGKQPTGTDISGASSVFNINSLCVLITLIISYIVTQ